MSIVAFISYQMLIDKISFFLLLIFVLILISKKKRKDDRHRVDMFYTYRLTQS